MRIRSAEYKADQAAKKRAFRKTQKYRDWHENRQTKRKESGATAERSRRQHRSLSFRLWRDGKGREKVLAKYVRYHANHNLGPLERKTVPSQDCIICSDTTQIQPCDQCWSHIKEAYLKLRQITGGKDGQRKE